MKGLERMQKKLVSIIAVTIVLGSMVLSACQPPGPTPEEQLAMAKARKDSVKQANAKNCMKYLSFGNEYYKNRSYEDALRNYNKLFPIECVDEKLAPFVYVYIANSHRELGNLDSALYYYDEGLAVLPSDKSLRESKIFVLNKMDNLEGVMTEKALLLHYDSTNIDLASELLDMYFTNGMYEESQHMASWILTKDNENRNALNFLRESKIALGEDILDVLKQRYDDDTSNIASARDYAAELLDRGESAIAMTVLENALTNAPEDIRILKVLSDVYSEAGQANKLIKTLKKLIEQEPKVDAHYYDLTQAYVKAESFKSALTWAEEAINRDNTSGQAYANRAKVYEAIANKCMGGVPDFSDKLVFAMALEDYQKALKLGYRKVTSKIEFLEQARVPQKGDWFFNKDDYVDSQGNASTKKECYNWVKRNIKAPKN